MIVAALRDRLGNQMFQYAAAKGLAAKQNTMVKIDKRYYDHHAPKNFFYSLDIFHLPQNFLSNREIREYTGLSNSLFHKGLRKLYKRHQLDNPNYIYDERFFQYDNEINSLVDKVYLRGYWQSNKYFSHIENDIKEDFKFKFPIQIEQDVFAKQIIDSNSVCLSIRRGEHIWNPIINKKYGQCDIKYYLKGLEIIGAKETNLNLFIFSDDIDWCSQNIKFDYPTVFVKHQFDKPRFDYYLQLMTLCKHFIIPVSTFPWWGAWLSDNKNKIVIAPKIWFTDSFINTDDLFPESWIRI